MREILKFQINVLLNSFSFRTKYIDKLKAKQQQQQQQQKMCLLK